MFNRQGECLEIVPSTGGGFTDKAEGVPESGAYAYAATGKESDEVIPESGAYAYAYTGRETDEVVSESGAYAYASTGKESDEVIPESGAYAAVTAETPADKGAPEERETLPPDSNGEPPSTRMASTIAEMIAEINRP
jgi:hypothetical protein